MGTDRYRLVNMRDDYARRMEDLRQTVERERAKVLALVIVTLATLAFGQWVKNQPVQVVEYRISESGAVVDHQR